MKKSIFNSFLFGILSGIIVQIIAFYIILLINKSILGFSEKSAFEFLTYLMKYDAGRSQIIAKLLSLAAIPDLLLFFIFIWTDHLKSARGVIASALMLGVVIIILKFT